MVKLKDKELPKSLSELFAAAKKPAKRGKMRKWRINRGN